MKHAKNPYERSACVLAHSVGVSAPALQQNAPVSRVPR